MIATVPFAGCVTESMKIGSASGSLSLSSTGTAINVSRSVVALSSWATGGSFTGATATKTIAVSVPPPPSEMVYVNWSTPLKPGAGVYTMVEPSFHTVPFSANVTDSTTMVSPSGSLSLSRTGIVTGISSSVTALSSSADGGAFTPATDTVTVAVSVPPFPSETM